MGAAEADDVAWAAKPTRASAVTADKPIRSEWTLRNIMPPFVLIAGWRPTLLPDGNGRWRGHSRHDRAKRGHQKTQSSGHSSDEGGPMTAHHRRLSSEGTVM